MRRILWFRRDLRVDDNPLLSEEGEVLPIFIFDPYILDTLEKNDRRVTFIFRNLLKLKIALKERGLNLALFYGKPLEVFEWILSHEKFDGVSASGDYDSYARERDRLISHTLPFNYLHDTYIFKPDEVLKNDGTPYLVFTPFYNRAKAIFRAEHMREHSPRPQHIVPFDFDVLHSIEGSLYTKKPIILESIGFNEGSLPPAMLHSSQQKLDRFVSKIASYPHDRDYMAKEGTSNLSSDLRFGTLSIRALLRWLLERKKEGIDTEPFFRELIFREFYAMLLYHFPHLEHDNFRYPFKGIENAVYYKAFIQGRTGVPIIDAGLQQLLSTGEMHNRIRMIAASYFTKNLLLPWQWGESFFAAHLNDYDAASNILSWQWSAGTGVDPQPYFRIFNPYVQTAKFDKQGIYIRRWLPQLKGVSSQELYQERRSDTFDVSDYPQALVDYKTSVNDANQYFAVTLNKTGKNMI